MKKRFLFASIIAVSRLGLGQQPMTAKEMKSPFSAADFQAAMELFGPSAEAPAAARDIAEAIRVAEAAQAEYGTDPENYWIRHPALKNPVGVPAPVISPDLLMMLSLVSPDLEAKARAYMTGTGLITGELADRWERERERLRKTLAAKKTPQ